MAEALKGLSRPHRMRGLKTRRQFLNAQRGRRINRPGFALEAVAVAEAEPGIGFTVTKRVGNAPERNRIKRRLRAAARASALELAPHHDYVIVGRRAALTIPFAELVESLVRSIPKVHSGAQSPQRTR